MKEPDRSADVIGILAVAFLAVALAVVIVFFGPIVEWAASW